MSLLKLGRAEHNRIRRSAAMQDLVAQVAAEIAAEAGQRAGDPEGYGHGDVTVGRDRARAHVWARSGEAIRAERKSSPLMQIVAARGPVAGDWWDGTNGRQS